VPLPTVPVTLALTAPKTSSTGVPSSMTVFGTDQDSRGMAVAKAEDYTMASIDISYTLCVTCYYHVSCLLSHTVQKKYLLSNATRSGIQEPGNIFLILGTTSICRSCDRCHTRQLSRGKCVLDRLLPFSASAAATSADVCFCCGMSSLPGCTT
jgi:hypothetical protein